MKSEMCRPLLAMMITVIVAGCASTSMTVPLPPTRPNGQVLWQIVNERCVPGQRDHGDPSPCSEVAISHGIQANHVVLKDRVGKSQFLVMPTIKITGIEDPRLLAPGTVNYFTPAWRTRKLVEGKAGRPLSRTEVSVAINSIYGRTQDLLHLHVDCLRTDVRDVLRRAAPRIRRHWTRQSMILSGHQYRAVRIDGDDVVGADPFRLLSRGLHVQPKDMGAWTLVLVGMDFPDGRPGFVLLAARVNPAAGYKASGEELEDHNCNGPPTLFHP
jgi:CDP-diacylglycerol pyrophosphatase